MKKMFLAVALIVSFSIAASAQSSLPALDKSPMDICYYPANFPVLKIRDKVTEPLAVRVIYSRPKKDGRVVYGNLVKAGEVWRLGANEATEVEFYKSVTIGGKKIAKGRYTMYAIANDSNWTFILNKETETWGAFKYDAAKDIIRTDVPLQKLATPVEALSMYFEKAENGTINLNVAWDDMKVALPINIQ